VKPLKEEVNQRIQKNKEEREAKKRKAKGNLPEDKKALNPDQIRAARLSMTTSMTQSQIAELLDVSRVTVSKWLNRPNVKAYMEEIRKAVERDTESYIINMFEDHRDILNDIARDKSTPPAQRIKAIETFWKSAGLFKTKLEITENETRKGLDNILKSEDAQTFLEEIDAEWNEE